MEYDAFICHASEDKAGVVDPLVDWLEQRGLEVWLDRMQIVIGDSLARKIDEGPARSRFGAVVISPSVLSKESDWVRRELDALAAREAQEGQVVVLPIWHEVGHQQVLRYSPTLASKLAAGTADGLEVVADMILRRCRPDLGTTADAGADPADTPQERPKPMPFTSPHSFMSPGWSKEWPPLLLRAVLNYLPASSETQLRIDSRVHRALPKVLNTSQLPSVPTDSNWDVAPGQYSTTVMTQYTASLADGIVGLVWHITTVDDDKHDKGHYRLGSFRPRMADSVRGRVPAVGCCSVHGEARCRRGSATADLTTGHPDNGRASRGNRALCWTGASGASGDGPSDRVLDAWT
jgi:hypothetical protein